MNCLLTPIVTSAMRTGSTRVYRLLKAILCEQPEPDREFPQLDPETPDLSQVLEPGKPYKSHKVTPAAYAAIRERNPNVLFIEPRRPFIDAAISYALYFSRTLTLEHSPASNIATVPPVALFQTDPDLVGWIVEHRPNLIDAYCKAWATMYPGPPTAGQTVIDYEFFIAHPAAVIVGVATRLGIALSSGNVAHYEKLVALDYMAQENWNDAGAPRNTSRGSYRVGTPGGRRAQISAETERRLLCILSRHINPLEVDLY